MGGIGLGYGVGAPEWIAELNKVRQPYNVNALTQAAAVALLSDTEWIAEQAAAGRAERARLQAALTSLPWTTVFPTQTNFMLMRVPDANATFQALLGRSLLAKNLHGSPPLT